MYTCIYIYIFTIALHTTIPFLRGFLACFIEDMVSMCGPTFDLNAGGSIVFPGILLSRNLPKARETTGFRKERWLERMGNQPLYLFDLFAIKFLRRLRERESTEPGRREERMSLILEELASDKKRPPVAKYFPLPGCVKTKNKSHTKNTFF